MAKFDVVQAWIDNVAYGHSKSKHTERAYKHNLNQFCEFIQQTPDQIVAEYEQMTDRAFRRTYARYLRAYISWLGNHNYAPGSIRSMVGSISSFFKYNDLPLAYVPTGRPKVTFHNRDITKEEITSLLEASRPRDKAFFCIMAQSGLRPHTLSSLKIKHIQPDFSDGIVPCKIEIPEKIAKGEYHAYFTFIGEESVRYLKAYLTTRPNLSPEDFLFTLHGTDKKLNSKSVSHIFRRTINRLREKGLIDFQQRKGKPSEVRLYNLRKWFRKQAHQAGFELVQFWMGHIVKEGVDEHYRPRDVEFHRQLYAEKAMPFLRLETATPSEHDKIILEQAREIEELKQKLKNLEDSVVLKADLSKPITNEDKEIATRYVEYVLHGEGKKILLNFQDGFIASLPLNLQTYIKELQKQEKEMRARNAD